jgi:hypothetical protein
MKQTTHPVYVTGESAVGDRPVRWRPSQKRTFYGGALVCLLCVASIGLVGWIQARQTLQLQSLAQHPTQPTTATITRRWRTTPGGTTQYWVAYRYPELPAGEPDGAIPVPRLVWEAMAPGARLSIRYSPHAPEVNGLMGNKPRIYSRWLRTGGLFTALIAIIPLAVYLLGWRSQRGKVHLLRHGATAVAEVTDVAETRLETSKRTRWRYEIEYRFTTPDGRPVVNTRVETSPEQKAWEIGAAVRVFYDPGNPSIQALYSDLPAEVLSVG